MTFLRTLVAAVVAIGLGAWLFYVEMPRWAERAKAEMLLSDYDQSAIQSFRLAYRDGRSIGLERSGDAWKLVEPLDYPAWGTTAEVFLQTIGEVEVERRLAPEEIEDLATYGLDGEIGAQARLELTRKDGTRLPAILVGNTTPVGHQAFVRLEGSDDVVVTPLIFHTNVRKTSFDFRERKLLPIDVDKATRLVVDKPGETLIVERNDDGTWALRAPIEDVADTEGTRDLIDSINTIDASVFYDGEEADREAFGLASPSARVEVTSEDGSKVRFILGHEAEDQPTGTYFERSSDGQVARVGDWIGRKFKAAGTELRNRRLLASCSDDGVRRIVWTVAGETFTAEREGPGKPWSLTPLLSGETVHQRAIDNVLRGLLLTRGETIVGDVHEDEDLPAFGLDAPSASVQLIGADGPCGIVVAAPAPAVDDPAGDDAGLEGQPPSRGPTWMLKAEGRSAVLSVSNHQYSRIGLARTDLVEVEEKPDASK